MCGEDMLIMRTFSKKSIICKRCVFQLDQISLFLGVAHTIRMFFFFFGSLSQKMSPGYFLKKNEKERKEKKRKEKKRKERNGAEANFALGRIAKAGCQKCQI